MERRKFDRIKKEVITHFEVVESPDEIELADRAKTHDISLGGMLFEANKPMTIGTILKIDFLDAKQKKIKVISRVVRVEEIMIEEKFEIGIAFINLKDEQKERIQEMIEKQ
ncbi:MAG: PilZ domain-containing protein [Leptospiraceae bacterium]|nr:PilZ domain-containing protein [Leptospiraceae bacterium]MCP5495316.1 PilZ domain-containing protein [Leptospiraceae bacterium]